MDIMSHPQIKAHDPRIILVAPPPINEHLWWPRDQSNGYASVTRLAGATKTYADAVVQLGAELGLPVVNLWKAFMARTDFKADIWKLGDDLPGSLDVSQNDALVELMYDGKGFAKPSCFLAMLTARFRASLEPSRIRDLLPGVDQGHRRAVAGSSKF